MNASAPSFLPRNIDRPAQSYSDRSGAPSSSNGVAPHQHALANHAGSSAPSMLRAYSNPYSVEAYRQPWQQATGQTSPMDGPPLPAYPSYSHVSSVQGQLPSLMNANALPYTPHRRPTSPAAAIHHLGDSIRSSYFANMPDVTVSAPTGMHERNLSRGHGHGHVRKATSISLKRLVPPAVGLSRSPSSPGRSPSPSGSAHSGLGRASPLSAFGLLLPKQRVCRVRFPNEDIAVKRDDEYIASLWRRVSAEISQEPMQQPLPPSSRTRPSLPEDKIGRYELPETIEIYLPNDWQEVRAQLFEENMAKLGIDREYLQHIRSALPTPAAPVARADIFAQLTEPSGSHSRYSSIAVPDVRRDGLRVGPTEPPRGPRDFLKSRSMSVSSPAHVTSSVMAQSSVVRPLVDVEEESETAAPDPAEPPTTSARRASDMTLKELSAGLGMASDTEREDNPWQYASQLMARSGVTVSGGIEAGGPIAADNSLQAAVDAVAASQTQPLSRHRAQRSQSVPDLKSIQLAEVKERDTVTEASPSPRPVSGMGYNAGLSEASDGSASESDFHYSNASEAEEARCRRDLVATGATASPIFLEHHESNRSVEGSESDDVISNPSDEEALGTARPAWVQQSSIGMPFLLHAASLSNASTDRSAATTALNAAARPFIMPVPYVRPLDIAPEAVPVTKSDLDPTASAFAPFRSTSVQPPSQAMDLSQPEATIAGDGSDDQPELPERRASLQEFRFPATPATPSNAVPLLLSSSPKQALASSPAPQLPHFGTIGRNTKLDTALLDFATTADESSDSDTARSPAKWTMSTRKPRQPIPTFDRVKATMEEDSQTSVPDTPASLSPAPSEAQIDAHGAQPAEDNEQAAEATSFVYPEALSDGQLMLDEAVLEEISETILHIPDAQESAARSWRMFKALLDRKLDALKADFMRQPNIGDVMQNDLHPAQDQIQSTLNGHGDRHRGRQQQELSGTVIDAIHETQGMLARLQTEGSKSLGTVLELLDRRLPGDLATNPSRSDSASMGLLEDLQATLQHLRAERVDVDRVMSDLASFVKTQMVQVMLSQDEERRSLQADVEDIVLRAIQQSQAATLSKTLDTLQTSSVDMQTHLISSIASETQHALQAALSDNGMTAAVSQIHEMVRDGTGREEAVKAALQAVHATLSTGSDVHAGLLRELYQELQILRQENKVQVEHFERAERRYDQEVSTLKEEVRRKEQQIHSLQDTAQRQAEALRVQHSQREAASSKEINNMRMMSAAMESEIKILNEQARAYREEIYTLRSSLDSAHKATLDLQDEHRNELTSARRAEAAAEERATLAEERLAQRREATPIAPADDKFAEINSALSQIQSELQAFVKTQQQRNDVFSNAAPSLTPLPMKVQHSCNAATGPLRDLAEDNALFTRALFALTWKEQHADDTRLLEDFTPGLAAADLAFEGHMPFEDGHLTIAPNGQLIRTGTASTKSAEDETTESIKVCRVASDDSGWYSAAQ